MCTRTNYTRAKFHYAYNCAFQRRSRPKTHACTSEYFELWTAFSRRIWNVTVMFRRIMTTRMRGGGRMERSRLGNSVNLPDSSPHTQTYIQTQRGTAHSPTNVSMSNVALAACVNVSRFRVVSVVYANSVPPANACIRYDKTPPPPHPNMVITWKARRLDWNCAAPLTKRQTGCVKFTCSPHIRMRVIISARVNMRVFSRLFVEFSGNRIACKTWTLTTLGSRLLRAEYDDSVI